MTIKDALDIVRDYYNLNNPSEKEEFIYVEAVKYLMEETKDPQYIMELGGYYYGKKDYELALKYYEYAAEFDYEPAYEGLGYIWYYGRTGAPDYEKAFTYYSKAAQKGNVVCKYKVADMYKNGYYVEKDYDKYKEIIKSLYPMAKRMKNVFDPIPEIYTRLAKIWAYEGKKEEAIELYIEARNVLAMRIRFNPFFGNLSIMKWLINDLYKLISFEEDDMEYFDLYYVLKKPTKVRFKYNSKNYEVESVIEDGKCVVRFQEKWYRSIDDFIIKACIGQEKLCVIADSLYMFEIIKD